MTAIALHWIHSTSFESDDILPNLSTFKEYYSMQRSPFRRWQSAAKDHSEDGAGDGNRTHVASLEGWCSTIELHPPATLRSCPSASTEFAPSAFLRDAAVHEKKEYPVINPACRYSTGPLQRQCKKGLDMKKRGPSTCDLDGSPPISGGVTRRSKRVRQCRRPQAECPYSWRRNVVIPLPLIRIGPRSPDREHSDFAANEVGTAQSPVK